MPTALPLLESEFLQAVHDGLDARPKTLPCRYFYDREGSLLFEAICELPEYYLTRTEDHILSLRADEIAAALPPGADVVELGSGSSRKTRRLLEALLGRRESLRYLPVDISREMLEQTAGALARDYPGLRVEPIAAEYVEGLCRVRDRRAGPLAVLFLGSNLGNFDFPEAVTFLGRIRAILREGDCAVVGLDLRKERGVLEAAYDDAAGVTARFNINLLRRINRELDADFDLSAFRHRAVYIESMGHVEMHLVAQRDLRVTVGGRAFFFEQGESIHTESSYKYTLPQIGQLGRRADLALGRTWTDERGWFSLNLFHPVGEDE